MKSIKNSLSLIILVFMSLSMYSQSKDSLSIKKPKTSIYYTFSTQYQPNYSLQFTKYKNQKNNYPFSIYNQATKLNDLYSTNKGVYYYKYSTKNIKNDFNTNKIDAFNPHGATDLGNAIVSGVLSSLFSL